VSWNIFLVYNVGYVSFVKYKLLGMKNMYLYILLSQLEGNQTHMNICL
jgi:hypothetical protein